MTGIDASQRKIIFPPRFLPYLEKHRIFELFHELTELLVQERPKDHVAFLKEVLPCAAKRRDKPRIVFIAPPSFEREKFAKEVAKILGIGGYTRYYLEMKDRERRFLEWLKKQETMKKPSEEKEDSCVCPGEFYLGQYEIPYAPPEFYEEAESKPSIDFKPSIDSKPSIDFKPSIDSKLSVVEIVDIPQKSPTVSVKEEEEDPCKGIRVCPCKRTSEENDDECEESDESDVECDKSDENDDDDKPKTDKGESQEEQVPKEESGGEMDIGKTELETETEVETTKETPTETSCVCESEEYDVDFGVLGRCEYSEKGWILIDFPANAAEAEHLAEQGAVPTHAVRLITGGEDEKNRHYKYLSKEWAAVYRSVPVMDIHVNGRDTPQLARDISRLLKTMPHRHAPMTPRVVLIGSRGSGTTTQANLLAQKYKMVHVEFQQEMTRVILQDDKFSEAYKRQLLTRPDPELEAAILEKILLAPRCRKRGWVLTGYPSNIDQMRMLDLLATPPNRIIFLEVPAKECFIRLFYRKTDWTDGTEYKLPALESFGMEGTEPVGVEPDVKDRLMSHPRDDRRQIIHDIELYFEEKEEMMKYCGKTAAYVNGNKSVDSVFELIDDIIIKPPPAEPPRNPLTVGRSIEEAYERLRAMRMDTGITHNNLLINPPDPIFKF